ncbi:putative CRISPR-associated protein [Nostoc sp. FACHB-87]|uniref:putative CRISPR-associated protein n=1 Tax=Nostocaceae TaxID=1162 RepID=UPI0016891AFB|nr:MULTISPECIES: putative CRISPR-associated protein [Nostocaceae]MBD2456637.1 putative CRISPR-associated protein [Nostoc sp. FACHB-87]MBD2477986.1 putative CRISPR-associated protein [Anabaena sp. FACHB-83]
MQKSKLVLTPVGALILAPNRLSESEKEEWNKLEKNNLINLQMGSVKGQKELEEQLVSKLKSLDINTEDGLRKTSPEIKSLAKIGINSDDKVILYASETPEGIVTARVIGEFIKQVWKCNFKAENIEVVSGLQVEDAGKFRSLGVVSYVESVVKKINDPNNFYSNEIILNATAGFKSLVPYTTLIGLLFKIPVKYIFETSSELLILPPIPVDFDLVFFDKIKFILDEIDLNSKITEDKIRRQIEPEVFEQLLPLLEFTAGEYTLSSLGIIVYERYKSPPALSKSKRHPNDKDHTRDFSQEPHRTTEFENFKERLKNCEWVDGFWYLKGADRFRQEVKQLGNVFHVAYGGIELKVEVTATHQSHYDIIKAAIEELM